MDIISKWEDVPDESSEIKLVSIKSIGDNEDKDGEKGEDKETTKSGETVKKDEPDKIKDGSGEKQDGDITLGTFGFPEVAVETTTSKAETSNDKETEKKKSDEKETAKATDKKEPIHAEDVGNKGPTKSGDELATSTGGISPSTPAVCL